MINAPYVLLRRAIRYTWMGLYASAALLIVGKLRMMWVASHGYDLNDGPGILANTFGAIGMFASVVLLILFYRETWRIERAMRKR